MQSPEKKTVAGDEKKRELFLRQKALLETFLATGAIDRRQHDKSLRCLREKMGFGKMP
ncbi:MAG: hypothetical protein MJ016_04730 [Victivallaceae bacterium]|nr:hypothetical protein [Victivallaceae bacterium]